MTPRTPRITPTTFFTSTSKASNRPSTPLTTIFFIPGNPGLIGYYHTFLALLSSRLDLGLQQRQHESNGNESRKTIEQDAKKTTTLKNQRSIEDLNKHRSSSTPLFRTPSSPTSGFQIYGRSLAGFEPRIDERGAEVEAKENDAATATVASASSSSSSSSGSGPRLYDLEEQIVFIQDVLERFVTESYDGVYDASTKPRVILMGHSVGSYIAMEVLRRHREKKKKNGNEKSTGTRSVDFDIIGGVMLFPTVVDIAKSASGQKLLRLLYFIPQLAVVASFFARLLTLLLPEVVLRFLINVMMKTPPAETVETTLAFLRSETGVKQALHMATSEMETITTDKWSDDVWGASTANEPLSKLFFYFGRNDHWVADRTRDEIIESRGRRDGERDGPEMFVCEDGLPHAFCLKHNDIMARKVTSMVEGITGAARP